ncbi:MAG: DUF4097 family beta strand repeat-containing protein [Armatimonadota bacterium]
MRFTTTCEGSLLQTRSLLLLGILAFAFATAASAPAFSLDLPTFPGARLSSQISLSDPESIASSAIGRAIRGAEELRLLTYKTPSGLSPEAVLQFYEKSLQESGIVTKDAKAIVRWVQGQELGVMAYPTKSPEGVFLLTFDSRSEEGTRSGEIVVVLVTGKVDLGSLLANLNLGSQTERMPSIKTKSVQADGVQKVRLETPRGPVWIRSVEGMPIRVRILGTSAGRAEEYGIDSVTRGGEVVLTAKIPPQTQATPVELVAPPNLDVEISAKEGAVLVQGPFKTAVDRTGDGIVIVRNVDRDASIVTGNGLVEVRDVSGALKIETGSGAIRGSGLTADSVQSTVKTGQGNLSLEYTRFQGGTLDASTSNGNILIQLPRNASVSLKGSAVNGRINLANPFRITSQTNGEVEAIMGDGRAQMRLHTSNGNITVEVK